MLSQLIWRWIENNRTKVGWGAFASDLSLLSRRGKKSILHKPSRPLETKGKVVAKIQTDNRPLESETRILRFQNIFRIINSWDHFFNTNKKVKTLVECFNVNDGGKLGFNWILKSRNSSTLPFEVFDLTGNLEIIWKLGQWRAADLYVRMKYVKLLFLFWKCAYWEFLLSSCPPCWGFVLFGWSVSVAILPALCIFHVIWYLQEYLKEFQKF